METVLNNISIKLDLFLLMFIRVSALIVSSPIFGRKTLPNILKVCLCLVLTYVMFAANMSAPVPRYANFIEFAMMCIKELLFGLVVGYVLTLFFSLVQISGQYIDMQMGFGMVNVLDAQNNLNVPITGELLNIVLMVSFFGANGHLKLIYIIDSTFSRIPVGAVQLNPLIGLTALEVFILAFMLAVNVALPLIASGLLGEVAMGFIVRAVPQINVFVVGIPMKIIIGFMILMLVLPVFVGFTDVIFNRMFESVDTMIAGLAP